MRAAYRSRTMVRSTQAIYSRKPPGELGL